MKQIFILTSLLLLTAVAFSQVDSLRYVDFHIHTTMKNYYRDVPAPDSIYSRSFLIEQYRTNPNWNWDGTKHRGGKPFAPGRNFSGFYGRNSRPEASWDLIAAMNPRPRVLCTSITPIEKRFVSNMRVPVLMLYPRIRLVNKLLVTRLDEHRQEVIHKGSSFNELMAEVEYLRSQPSNPKTGKQDVRLVNDAADLQAAIRNNETGLVLTIEGAHSLMGNNTIGKEFDTTFGINAGNIDEIYRNVDSLKKMTPHVFFMTFSHMSWNAMCGQAKSLDMKNPIVRFLLGHHSEDKRFRNIAAKRFTTKIGDTAVTFRRKDDAIAVNPCACTDERKAAYKLFGWEVLDSLLDNRNGQHRILIDLRHMAIQGRQQYIRLVERYRLGGDTIPIVISHAAVNGKTREQASFFGSCPFADRYLEVSNPEKFYRLYGPCMPPDVPRVDISKTGWFHPFSINLYDEEIAAVYRSGGIIGITLEERVLGTGRHNYTKAHLKELKNAYQRWPGKDRFCFEELQKLEPFMRNLLYIVDHSGHAGAPESWRHVALGSDFDGMIDPIDVCASPEDIPKFYEMLCNYVPVFARDILGRPDLLAGQDIKMLMNMLFYTNGEAFIYKHFK
jgi:microsomal dipeptidase-like Zn-dependent dipeptidase